MAIRYRVLLNKLPFCLCGPCSPTPRSIPTQISFLSGSTARAAAPNVQVVDPQAILMLRGGLEEGKLQALYSPHDALALLLPETYHTTVVAPYLD